MKLLLKGGKGCVLISGSVGWWFWSGSVLQLFKTFSFDLWLCKYSSTNTLPLFCTASCAAFPSFICSFFWDYYETKTFVSCQRYKIYFLSEYDWGEFFWFFFITCIFFPNIAAVKKRMVFSWISSLVQCVSAVYLSYLPHFRLVQKVTIFLLAVGKQLYSILAEYSIKSRAFLCH